MKVTIKDIAREAGLSISAVSLVLNDRPCRISEEKRKLILDTAERLNYIPNQIAKSLVTKETKTIGLILPDITNMFFCTLANCIENRLREKGYVVIFSSTNDNSDNEVELIRKFGARNIDGLFIIVSNDSYENPKNIMRELEKVGAPFIMLDREYEDYACNKVRFDNEEGAYMAVSHLIEKGHKKIGCITNRSRSSVSQERLRGYKRALQAHDLEVNEAYISYGDYRFKGGYEAAMHLSGTDITAVFICNDMMTLGFLKKIYEHNVSIPEQLSVVSYDHAIGLYTHNLEITSIEQNVEKFGEVASERMFELIKGDKQKKSIILKPQLIKGTSVKQK